LSKILGQCTACLLWGRSENLTPLYERDKPHLILYYCPICLPGVKKDVEEMNDRAVSYGHLPIFWFGKKGEHLDKNND
jgi:hypothetical protein